MTSLFISYSRKDTDSARRLTEVLKSQDFDFWIDWEDIPPTVDWFKEIEKGIEQAGVFLFLVSPDSIRSRICRREIDHALKNGKRLIPIVVREVKVEDTPTVLSHLNWIFLRESDDFDSGISKLITAVKTDYDWIRAHRDLQIKALEWERGRRDKSFLLRGTELQLAEFQLKTNTAREPHPTELQREYVSASRKDTDRQRRNTAILAILAILALAVLAVWGWGKADLATRAQATAEANATTADIAKQDALAQKGTAQAASTEAVAQAKEAQKQANIAFSRQLAAEAQSLQAEQFDLALLLAIEASRDTTDGKVSLSNLLRAEPHLIRIVNSGDYLGQGPGGFITGLALSPDGNQLVAQSDDGAGLWDLNTNETRALSPKEYQQRMYDWTPYQIPSPNPGELFQFLKINDPNGTSSAVSNQAAFATCRTVSSAGGAPGCTSLIYIVSAEFERLITPLQSCTTNENARRFDIRLEGGLYHIQNLKSATGQPADYELYSVAQANQSSNVPNNLVDAVYDPQTNRLATAASAGRLGSYPALIVWDLTDKRPIMELYPDPVVFKRMWEGQSARMIFPNGSVALDICLEDASVQIDIDPASWRTQACALAGRNLTEIEWRYFFGDELYRLTCPQWSAGT
jgi:WD40 repeat protein